MRTSLLLILLLAIATIAPAQDKPLRIGIAGMTHDHVYEILNRAKKDDIEVVGYAEPNKELAMRHFKRFNIPESMWFATLEDLIEKTKPEAVCAYNSIFEHKRVVEICAPKGIHVMVEKPLAVSMEHLEVMEKLALKHKIFLMTNFETSWYASHYYAYREIHDRKSIGDIRKVVIMDGHKGPKEIGCSPEFLKWLTDPVMNGGGAVVDFGCYGANLMTWLQKGERPVSVTAVLQTIKPDVYPKVDDEATIVLAYPHAQAIIQASWNWPVGRKDTEIYGSKGYIFANRNLQVKMREDERAPERSVTIDPLAYPNDNSFSYLAAVIRGKITPGDDLASLKVNRIVVEILDAARESAKTGKAVYLKK